MPLTFENFHPNHPPLLRLVRNYNLTVESVPTTHHYNTIHLGIAYYYHIPVQHRMMMMMTMLLLLLLPSYNKISMENWFRIACVDVH